MSLNEEDWIKRAMEQDRENTAIRVRALAMEPEPRIEIDAPYFDPDTSLEFRIFGLDERLYQIAIVLRSIDQKLYDVLRKEE